jgi:sodium-dependent dicarboxylate transporter 2/3/5
MFGGGLTMASGLKEAGWMNWLGDVFAVWSYGQWSLLVLIIAISILLTALMSNLAMVAVFIPIVAQIATELQYPILGIAIPVALASSCDFMFPMSTPPNAIAYSSGHVSASQMFKIGFLVNVAAFILLIAWMSWMS